VFKGNRGPGGFWSLIPAGAPARPLLEAGLLFAALYFVAYLPSDPSATGRSLGQPGFHLLLLVDLVPKALLVLYLIGRSDGFPAFGLAPPRSKDIFRGVLAALGALAIIAVPSLALGALGLRNPLLGASAAPSVAAWMLAPLILVSSLSVGYGEELFFRVYLMRRLEQSGLPPAWALIVSSLIFGSAHGLQGVLGLCLATLLGLWFGWRWLQSRDIHEIALGHAIYDAAVIAVTLYR